MKLFRRIKKLRTKLMIIFTFQVFLLLGIALLVSFFLARSSSRKNLQMLNQQLKTLADSDFQDIFDEIDRAYLSIVASSNFSELYNARSDSTPLEIYELYYDVDSLLTAPLASSRYIHSINYLTPDNKILISSIAGELSMERDFSVEESPEWFWLHTRLLNTVGSLSETYIPPHQELYYQRTSSSANRTVVSVVRKTASFDTGYKNRGLLYFNVELSDFVSLTDSLNLYPDMETVILTDTGRVIHDSSGSITEQTGNIALLRECTSEQPITLDGKKYMAVPVTMKDPGWSICSLIPWSVYTADIRGYTVYSLILGMLVFIAGFIMTWIMSARISAPAEELSRTMKSVRSGNIRQHASVISSDEIGELSATFNTMLDRINLLIEQEYQLKVKQQDAQMKALQAQINPHFLYNILQSIASIASLNHLPEISVMANSLGKMMRYSIKTEENTTTLDDELIHVAHYLEIQKIRFKNQLDYSIDSCEAYGRYPLLKLTLQPLVENAVMHGFTGDHQKLFIYIHVYQEGTYLVIEISDDGAGMTEDVLAKVRRSLSDSSTGFYSDSQQSIGLANVYTRLKLCYQRQAVLDVDSEPEVGTVISLKLPFYFNHQGDKEHDPDNFM